MTEILLEFFTAWDNCVLTLNFWKYCLKSALDLLFNIVVVNKIRDVSIYILMRCLYSFLASTSLFVLAYRLAIPAKYVNEDRKSNMFQLTYIT